MDQYDLPLPPDAPVAGATDSGDQALQAVVGWLAGRRNLRARLARVVRRAIDEVLDGPRTGRYLLASLQKTEKTYLGTKVEIVLRSEFDLARGKRMDYSIAGHEVDCKFSLQEGGVMIPREAVGRLCLIVFADDVDGEYSVGVVRADESALTRGRNRDRKRSLSAAGKARIAWLARRDRFRRNLLSQLPSEVVREILEPAGKSAQGRVNDLFLHVQRRIIARDDIATVARTQDPMKRVRRNGGARSQLQPRGVLILGHQDEHPRIAKGLGLDVPVKGEVIAARIVPAMTGSGVPIAGDEYRLADAGDPVVAGPRAY